MSVHFQTDRYTKHTHVIRETFAVDVDSWIFSQLPKRMAEAFCNVLVLLLFFVLPYFTHFLLFILGFSFFSSLVFILLCCAVMLDFLEIQRVVQKIKKGKKKLYIHTTYVIHIYNFPSSTINKGTYTQRNKMREKKWKKLFHKANNNTHTLEKGKDREKERKKMRKTTSTASLIHQLSASILAGGFSRCLFTIFLFDECFRCRRSCCCWHHSQVAKYIANLPLCTTSMLLLLLLVVGKHFYILVLTFRSLSIFWFACSRFHLSYAFFLYFCHPALVHIAPFNL